MNELAAVVLAAGKGTRMPTDLPKVLHPVGGEPMLLHVLRSAGALEPARLVLVLGHRAEEVRAALPEQGIETVEQPEQRGTGDAVQRTAAILADFTGTVLVLYGDVPLLTPLTLRAMLAVHRIEGNVATILTATVDDPSGYGRIVRDERGFCTGIIEDRDLTPEERLLPEINSGILAFEARALFAALRRLRPENRQGELYLTDAIGLLHVDGGRIGTFHASEPEEILGVNTPEQLAEVERHHVLRAHRQDGGCPLCTAAGHSGALVGPPGGPGQHLLAVGEQVCLMLAMRPFNNGHLMLFPKRHVTSTLELDAPEQAELARWMVRGEDLLRRAYRCDAMNLGYNSGSGEHLALHLIPRWRGDLNFLPLLSGLKLVPESPSCSWRRLREALQ